MKDVLEYSLKKLIAAHKKLEEGIEQAIDELDKDGIIQRFEFTFELFKLTYSNKHHPPAQNSSWNKPITWFRLLP